MLYVNKISKSPKNTKKIKKKAEIPILKACTFFIGLGRDQPASSKLINLINRR